MASQGSQVISGVLQANPKYDPSQSFDPIAMVGRVPMLLIINPKLPVNDFKELIALARTRTLTYGSAGAGTVMHIAGELINTGANVALTHVPYRGVAPALPDLIGGRLDVIPADPPVLLPLVRTNTVRAIAVLGRERLASLPKISDAGRTRLSRYGDGKLVRPAGAGRTGARGRDTIGDCGAGRNQVAESAGAHAGGRAERYARQPGVSRPDGQRCCILASDAAEARHLGAVARIVATIKFCFFSSSRTCLSVTPSAIVVKAWPGKHRCCGERKRRPALTTIALGVKGKAGRDEETVLSRTKKLSRKNPIRLLADQDQFWHAVVASAMAYRAPRQCSRRSEAS